MLVLLVGLVIALALALHTLVVAPLRRMENAVEQLQAGDLSARVPAGAGAEVGRLGRAINEMAESLRESRDELQERNRQLGEVADRHLLMLDAVFGQTPVGLAFVDPDLRVVRANDALAAVAGMPVSRIVDRPLREVDSAIARDCLPLLEQVLRTGESVSQHERTVHAPELQAALIDAYPVRQDARLLGIGLVVTDITELSRARREREQLLQAERRARQASERARRRASFLAEASAVLDASLELEEHWPPSPISPFPRSPIGVPSS